MNVQASDNLEREPWVMIAKDDASALVMGKIARNSQSLPLCRI
jgi:hypothetical protein